MGEMLSLGKGVVQDKNFIDYVGNDMLLIWGDCWLEGYGFEQDNSGHQKIPHLGKVIIEDDVEIGANTC